MENTKPTVLVVDDTITNIEILLEILKEDYRVKAALNGEEALKIVNSADPPDIVLLDVMMPGMDGFETCRQMKSKRATGNIPVIFVTTRDTENDQRSGFQLGAVDYITKPFAPAVVLARVKTHLALHQQNRLLEEMVRKRTRELYSTRLEIIRRLGVAAEYKDNETGLHIIRMSKYCRVIALNIGLPDSDVELLLNAAPMHDVGKIGIPDHILCKPGKLTPDERKIMQTHTTIGAKIIGHHENELMQLARNVALTHHEKWDGSGYPYGLSGDEIPIEGRIAAIADVFDALTSERPYKEEWPVQKALDLISDESGKHFEPRLVETLFNSLDEILAIKIKHSS
ncbi:HD domain-containing phosphohydrolase [Maridesulfovibrio sp. FT414]|uniref:HD domain-containing phosphohydrolase n=1 Tax=Maridesulfovibrio sp. FT414 TaxID=2979469 RepID=UPI003D8038F2